MAIDVKDSRTLRDKFGILGKAILDDNEITNIYQTPIKTKYSSININILNPLDLDAEVSIWISELSEPTDVDLIEYRLTLVAGAVYVRTNFSMAPKEIIFIKSNLSGLIVRIDGFEDNRV